MKHLKYNKYIASLFRRLRMVRNRNEDSDDSIVKTEASQGNREQSRGRTNSRGKFRGRQQNMAKNEEQGGKDMQGTSAVGQAHSQGAQKSSKSHDAYNRDNSRQRGFYRDKGKGADRDHQKYAGRHGGSYKNREEETIDDIRRDIERIEKEIELEIKEIRSMKFL